MMIPSGCQAANRLFCGAFGALCRSCKLLDSPPDCGSRHFAQSSVKEQSTRQGGTAEQSQQMEDEDLKLMRGRCVLMELGTFVCYSPALAGYFCAMHEPSMASHICMSSPARAKDHAPVLLCMTLPNMPHMVFHHFITTFILTCDCSCSFAH